MYNISIFNSSIHCYDIIKISNDLLELINNIFFPKLLLSSLFHCCKKNECTSYPMKLENSILFLSVYIVIFLTIISSRISINCIYMIMLLLIAFSIIIIISHQTYFLQIYDYDHALYPCFIKCFIYFHIPEC